MQQTVLVVDDEKNIVNIIAFNLKKEGYDVITAGDGEEAVAVADEKNPDLRLGVFSSDCFRCGRRSLRF